MKMTMPLDTLAAFDAAARLLNLSRAGEELAVSDAAIRSSIRRLETWFGHKLFKRSGSGLRLTPAGQEFRRSLDEASAAIQAAGQVFKESLRVAFRVACLPSVAIQWLVPALADFQLQHPAILVEIMDARPREDFDPDRHDLLITTQRTIPRNVWATKVLSRLCKPVASPRYVAEHPNIVGGRLDDVTLLHDEFVSDWDEWFRMAGYAPENITQGPVFADFNYLSTALIAGLGVALCPVAVFRKELAAGELITLSDTTFQPDEDYYMISGKKPTREVVEFAEWFQDICEAD